MGCATYRGCLHKKPRSLTSQKVLQFQLNARKLIEEGNLKDAQKIADSLFEDCQWEEAAAVYKRIIEHQPDLDYQIDGLGCIDEQVGYYIKNVQSWYKNQKYESRIKGTPYDALSLCLSKTDRYNWDSFSMRKNWYEQMIESHPQNYQLHFGLANLLSNQAIYEEAVVAYMTTIELKPNFVKPYVDIAFIYEFGRVQKSQSIDWANKALAIERNNQFGLFIIAKNERNPQVRIETLKYLADMFPRYVRIADEIGKICHSNHTQSIKWFKQCIQQYPQYETACNNIGVVYEEMDNYESAMKWYFKACEIDCSYQDSHKNLITIFDKLNLSDEDILSKSRAYNLKRDAFYYEIGLSYYNKKMVDRSTKWFSMALQLNKYNYHAYNGLGLTYDSRDEHLLAIQNYLKCIKIKPDYYMAYYNIAMSNSKKKDIEQAIKWYIKAINVHPRYYKVYNHLGNIHKDREQNEQAIKWYAKAVEHNSTYALGWVNMGICHIKMQNYKVSFHCFKRALQIFPTDNGNMEQVRQTLLRENTDKFNATGDNCKRCLPINPQIKQRLNQLMGYITNKLKSNSQNENQAIAKATNFIVKELEQN